MSNLNSLFQIEAGLPPHISRGALKDDFVVKTGEGTITEGMIVAIEDAAGSPVVAKLTSANEGDEILPDFPWVVYEGNDQSDAEFVGKITCLSLRTGMVVRFPTADAFSIGDLVYANAGVVTKVDAAQQAFGQVIDLSSGSYIVVAT